MDKSITILGVTASGKTKLAVNVADKLNCEIISADSRQIYRGMDLGTGKEIDEYKIGDKHIPYHLIDIRDAGYKYNLFQYKADVDSAIESIKENGSNIMICGGTGLYLETILKGVSLPSVPENIELRASLANKNLEELNYILSQYNRQNYHNQTDTCKRTIRAIEIEEYYKGLPLEAFVAKPLNSLIVGIDISREERRKNITARLKSRLDEGMIAEVEGLLASGIPPADLIYYGLEYKFLTEYVTGEYDYDTMFMKLETAIHQFAKRQMTWFRGMERRGFKINWVDYNLSDTEKVAKVSELWDDYIKGTSNN